MLYNIIPEVRLIREEIKEYNPIIINSSKSAIKYIRPKWENINIFESFYVIFLSADGSIISYAQISKGNTDQSILDQKILFKYAIDTLANALILFHNHPSGNKNPSTSDKNVTIKIKQGCEIFGIRLLDHIILTEKDSFSFADNLLM